jgi:hypothetical protein
VAATSLGCRDVVLAETALMAASSLYQRQALFLHNCTGAFALSAPAAEGFAGSDSNGSPASASPA